MAAALAALVTALNASAGDFFLIDGMMVDDISAGEARDLGHWAPPPLDVRADASRLSGMIMANLPEIPRSSAEINRSRGHLEAADNYIRSGEYAKALLELKDGLALNPRGHELLSRAGVIAATLRRFSEAEGYMRRYLQERPTDLVHLSGLAAVLIRLARLDEAGAIIDRLERLRTEYLPARFNRLCIQVIREVDDIDRDWWTRRTIEEVGLTSAWLASDRMDLIQVMGAEDYALVCDIALGPGTSDRVQEIATASAEAYQRQSQSLTAELSASLDRLQSLGVHGTVIDRARADLLAASGNGPGAIAIWKRLLESSPEWPEGWMLYGRLQMKFGAHAEAAAALRKALDQSPKDDRFRFYLACARALNGELKAAQEDFEDLARRRSRDMRSWIDADEILDRALKRVPNYTAILRRIEIPPESE
jgi:predicted Zn-dependent protease